MDRYWLKSYPAGIPAEINPAAYGSLRDLIDTACVKHADRPAYTSFGRTLTFRQLDHLSRAFAAWLQHEARLEPGERIALMMPNVLQYPIAVFGALRAGLIVVNVNPLYTHRELTHQLQDAGASAILVYENAAQLVSQCLPETSLRCVLTTGIGDLLHFPRGAITNFVLRYVRRQVPPYELPESTPFLEALEQGQWVDPEPVKIAPEDVAFLQYTGGTTGVAKGAMLTHRNLVANTLQSAACLGQYGGDRGRAVVLAALPLYHIFALTSNAFLWLVEGGENVLVANPRDLPGLVEVFRRHRFTHVFGVNTLFNGLLHTPGFDSVDFSQLKASIAGGMALQGTVAERWKAVTGCILSQGWGLTETSPVVTMMPAGIDFNGSIGLPVPSTEIALFDDAGRPVEQGQLGEICVRGPQVMQGYWKRSDETANVFVDGGWLRTGDIGRMDDNGYVYIEDRKKDMILVSGFNVFPNEVEAVIASQPGVREVAAVPEPDERSGEVVSVFIVRSDPNLTAESVIEHARTELTGYKVPRHVYFRSELPKTNVGKILRRALREELAKPGPH